MTFALRNEFENPCEIENPEKNWAALTAAMKKKRRNNMKDRECEARTHSAQGKKQRPLDGRGEG